MSSEELRRIAKSLREEAEQASGRTETSDLLYLAEEYEKYVLKVDEGVLTFDYTTLTRLSHR